jgi:uncharacterized protein with GYD domain
MALPMIVHGGNLSSTSRASGGSRFRNIRNCEPPAGGGRNSTALTRDINKETGRKPSKGVTEMAKYMVQSTLTGEGMKGVEKDTATGRKAAVTKAIEGLGGKVEALYFSLGEYDVVVIADMPDIIAATAMLMHVNDSGLVRTKTTALLTVDEVDQAIKRKVAYRAPGR